MIKKVLNEWIIPIVIAFILFLIFNQFIGLSRISGSSMYPTYHEKQVVLLNKFFYNNFQEHQRGDIIIFDSGIENTDSIFDKDKQFLKRIIAIPGDHLEIKNEEVILNGEVLNEEFLPEEYKTIGDIDITLGDDEYFVMGDNRENSLDSRVLGAIDEDKIIGKVIFTIF